jgi:hypothetical protein
MNNEQLGMQMYCISQEILYGKAHENLTPHQQNSFACPTKPVIINAHDKKSQNFFRLCFEIKPSKLYHCKTSAKQAVHLSDYPFGAQHFNAGTGHWFQMMEGIGLERRQGN